MRARRAVIRADVAILDDDAAAPVEFSERREHRGAGHLDQRLRRQSGLELLEEPRRRGTVPIARARQANPEREAIIRLDAGRLREHRLETSQREAGADEQHRRQRDLDDDEAEKRNVRQAHRTTAAFLERL